MICFKRIKEPSRDLQMDGHRGDYKILARESHMPEVCGDHRVCAPLGIVLTGPTVLQMSNLMWSGGIK